MGLLNRSFNGLGDQYSVSVEFANSSNNDGNDGSSDGSNDDDHSNDDAAGTSASLYPLLNSRPYHILELQYLFSGCRALLKEFQRNSDFDNSLGKDIKILKP